MIKSVRPVMSLWKILQTSPHVPLTASISRFHPFSLAHRCRRCWPGRTLSQIAEFSASAPVLGATVLPPAFPQDHSGHRLIGDRRSFCLCFGATVLVSRCSLRSGSPALPQGKAKKDYQHLPGGWVMVLTRNEKKNSYSEESRVRLDSL
nr:hypothetical protein CFP56_20716 [Quercus suber]